MKTAILTAILLCLSLASCYQVENKEVMGTFAEIKTTNSGKIEEAFSEIRRIESVMSIYDENTEISGLNKLKEKKVSDELLSLIMKSLYYSNISKGAFDITILPLLDLYRHSFSTAGQPPSEEEINSELRKVGFSNVKINSNIVTLENNASIDLGGIAKGYAIDRAMKIIEKGIVNIGGDLAVKGKTHYIALVDPDNKDNFITKFKLQDGCIATSGNYERYFDKEKKAHHIMDPRTGRSAQGIISVTVIGKNKNAVDCDALATSVFVLGKNDGLNLIDSLQDFETLIIDDQNNIFRSKNIRDFEVS